jgi:hypothetical protein
MTYALSVILWMTIAQADAGTEVVQSPPSDAERALRAQLEEARAQLDEAHGQLGETRRKLAEAKAQAAKLKEESSMPDHATAALLVSDRADLAWLRWIGRRHVTGTGRWQIRRVQVDVYGSPHAGETMTAVMLTVRNPREAPTWEPKEAFFRPPFYRREEPPVPVAVRSSPERIRPGETARIVVVFDRVDVDFSPSYATLALLRDGEPEMSIELVPSDFQVASAISGDGQ